MLLRGGRGAVSREAYPDLAEFRADIARVYREELAQLGEAGCTYVQLDDTNFAYLCDPKFCDAFRHTGDDPDAMPERGPQGGRPADVLIAIVRMRAKRDDVHAMSEMTT
jgi:5-methyltetrahydropteroyltriglutamate--homocysteine methyltransferase